ncbi:tRNA (adenine-N1)-methyltransferase [Thermogladius sp. 4427co]|uniref:tRNA (adenine-N1)-methyltransferase n=1 Tax=Thermogladius sp. 4427co TaxID=3450718 RepID=UPI003F7ADAB3
MPLKEGDTVLIYIDPRRKFVQKLKTGGILGTDKGLIKHDDIIGKEIGSTVPTSRGGKAFLLKPLPIDFLPAMKRVTQVIYPKDLGFIVFLAGLHPGCKVLEGGVGTGHVTAALAYMVGENGKVYAVEIDEEKLSRARENLAKLGLDTRVVFVKKDIREGVDETGFDAAILDIPDPWNALRPVHDALKPSSPLIAFTPTVNQVEKTVLEMRKMFIDIHVFEILLREYLVSEGAVRPVTRMIGHTGYVIFGRKI